MELSHIQIISATVCVLLLVSMIVAPVKARRFVSYNVARNLLLLALGLMSVQFICQFVFQIRQDDPMLGSAFNLLFNIPCSVLMFWSILLCIRGKRVDTTNLVIGGVLVVLNTLAIVVGRYYADGMYMDTCVGISSFYAVFAILYFTIYSNIQVRKVRKAIDEFYDSPVGLYVDWMLQAMMMLFVSIVFSFLAGMFNNLLFLAGLLFWSSLLYYVVRFNHFAYHAKSIFDSIEMAREEQVAEQEMGPEQESATNNTTEPITNTTMRTKSPDQPVRIYTSPLLPDRVQRLEAWVAEKGYCTQGISIVDVAVRIGTNRTTLSQYINAELHTTFRDWINDLRCEEAKRLWTDDPDLSVDEITERSGFTSRKYFDQVFSEVEGITPAAYRKSLRNR